MTDYNLGRKEFLRYQNATYSTFGLTVDLDQFDLILLYFTIEFKTFRADNGLRTVLELTPTNLALLKAN
ncbi:hypothetical protein M0804_009907 [Polistes exclamans]|nr:hypothetical protein M0804_009907 [Polistes exclamans]